MLDNIPTKDVIGDFAVIDVDTHLSEPHDLWTSRAPAKWRDVVPQIKMVDGRRTWFIDGDQVIGPAIPASVIRLNGEKTHGMEFMDMEIEDVHEGSHSTRGRLAAMDEMGVYAQIVYPNLLGFGGQRASQVDANVRLVSIQIYNDAMAEMQEESGQRLFPMALLPWWDMTECVKEVERCHAMGLRGVNTNSDPHVNGLPDLGTEHWYPLWEACSGLGLPINFHIGASDESMTWFGSSPWPSFSDEKKLALGSAMMYFSNARVIANILYSGILERYPQLKFVSVESGIGWIPFLLEGLDYQLRETAPSALKHMKMMPSEYFRRQIYGCFWFEREDLPEVIRRVGEDNVMFETDYPHPTCLYPNPIAYGANALARMSPEAARKIMGGNAARVYNITLPTR